MSAEVLHDRATPEEPARARLRLVPAGRSTVSTLGFALMMGVLVALGMGLVMVVTTAVGAQSKELAAQRQEATELGYTRAALTTQLQSRTSAGSLALRAADLGMVPNPYPAFINLADGAILGTPRKVVGNEAPYLRRPPAEKPVPPKTEVVAGQKPSPAPAVKPSPAPAAKPSPAPAAKPTPVPTPKPSAPATDAAADNPVATAKPAPTAQGGTR